MKGLDLNDGVSTLVFWSVAALPLVAAAIGGPVIVTVCAMIAVAFLVSELSGLGIDRDYVWIRWSAIGASSLVVLIALARLVVWVAYRPDVLVALGVGVFVVARVIVAIYRLHTQDALVSEYADQKDRDVR